MTVARSDLADSRAVADDRQGLADQGLQAKRLGQGGERGADRVLDADQPPEHPRDGPLARAGRASQQQDLVLAGVGCEAVAQPILEGPDDLCIGPPDRVEELQPLGRRGGVGLVVELQRVGREELRGGRYRVTGLQVYQGRAGGQYILGGKGRLLGAEPGGLGLHVFQSRVGSE